MSRLTSTPKLLPPEDLMSRLTSDPDEAKWLSFLTRRDQIEPFSDSRETQVRLPRLMF